MPYFVVVSAGYAADDVVQVLHICTRIALHGKARSASVAARNGWELGKMAKMSPPCRKRDLYYSMNMRSSLQDEDRRRAVASVD